jgi:hypothetical protein
MADNTDTPVTPDVTPAPKSSKSAPVEDSGYVQEVLPTYSQDNGSFN